MDTGTSYTEHECMSDQDEEFLSILAYIYLRHGQAATATPLLEALRCLQPEDRHTARSLAYAYLLEHRYDQCLELTSRLMKTPSSGDAAIVDLIHRRAQQGQQTN